MVSFLNSYWVLKTKTKNEKSFIFFFNHVRIAKLYANVFIISVLCLNSFLYQSTQFLKQLLTSPSISSINQSLFMKSRFKFKKYLRIVVHDYMIYLISLQGIATAVTFGHAINLRHTALIKQLRSPHNLSIHYN